MVKSKIEKTYGKIFNYAVGAINPFKKKIVRTECIIHKIINVYALEILKNDKYLDAYNFYSDYIAELNEGVVWADQDLKSTGHFYSPEKMRGLYGNKDALTLTNEYYYKAIMYWRGGDIERSMFFLGAASHIIQDMTIPQHANIKLLADHRKYENFIKRTYIDTPSYFVDRGGYYLGSINEFVHCNARVAIIIYKRLKDIKEDEKRFLTIAKFTLPLAQKTTAGCLLHFYKEVLKNGNINEENILSSYA